MFPSSPSIYHALRLAEGYTSDVRSEWIRLNRKGNRKFYCVDDRPGEGNYQKCIIKKEATMEYGTTLLP